MSTVEDLRLLGAAVGDPVAVARFISALALDGAAQARLFRSYLRETGTKLTREIMIEARDYSFWL